IFQRLADLHELDSLHKLVIRRLLSYTIAEWACALKYEDLSPEVIQAAKLFWFDSIGCALGGSQQDDATSGHAEACPSGGTRFRASRLCALAARISLL
ncbi:MAG: MmgE/PrpD family protein, partial [Chthoniobacterales bacterium]